MEEQKQQLLAFLIRSQTSYSVGTKLDVINDLLIYLVSRLPTEEEKELVQKILNELDIIGI